ncbi:MAG: PAS domain-containing protein [Cohaesibacteraceae bacterium]|nr:PAS domain-containing protein [Cohaesibacteraceae bacterium]
MKDESLKDQRSSDCSLDDTARIALNGLPHPVFMLNQENRMTSANDSAQAFFQVSAPVLSRHNLDQFVPFGSPLLSLIEDVRSRNTPVNEYKVDIGTPRLGRERIVDINVAPVVDSPGHVVVMLQERTMADKMDRQLTHQGAARSVSGLAMMLAHEIKNPLSGIRGAAQLLESTSDADDRILTRLIIDETDRIVKLVERMEVFSDERPISREAVNIHEVLEHVRRLAASGFAKGIEIREQYDPSLPPVYANRDQLIQIFLNLVKNAAEAVKTQRKPEICLTTAFKPGVRLSMPGIKERTSLPLEFCVHDNGGGVPDDIAPHMFDPFVTTKANGGGLGLALVAKLVRDHGGVIDCQSQPRDTTFRVLLPAFKQATPDNVTDESQ